MQRSLLALTLLGLAACAAQGQRAPHALTLPPPPVGWHTMLALQAEHGSPGARAALLEFTSSEEERVRARAVFCLGLDHPQAYDAVVDLARTDSSALVRARAMVAAARLRPSDCHQVLLEGLSDGEPAVRAAAAHAAHLASVGEGSPIELDARLAAVSMDDEDDEARWQALFSLARRGVDHLAAYARGARPDRPVTERLFAARGLARTAQGQKGSSSRIDDRECLPVLLPLLSDEDERVRLEAVRGLRPRDASHSVEPLLALVNDPSFHVRAAVAESLAATLREGELESAYAALIRLREDTSPTVRCAGLTAEARLAGAAATARIEALALDADPRIRAAAAQGSPFIEWGAGLAVAQGLAGDSHPRVAGAAIEALGAMLTQEDVRDSARASLLAILAALEDNGLRLAAAMALTGSLEEGDLPLIERVFDQAEGDIAPELQFNLVRAAAPLPMAEAFLRRAQGHPHRYVAEVAQAALLERGIDLRTLQPLPARATQPPAMMFACEDPLVLMRTTKGDLLVQLFAQEAPRHVTSFLKLAERGHYDGLSFHRVVGDFVVQGGCYRGDGNGSGTSWGPDTSLAGEFNPIPYLTGALGMPRNEDPDSGGSQVFFTHRPTPHLDGRYTLFGQLVQGFETLHALEIGDEILSVEQVVLELEPAD